MSKLPRLNTSITFSDSDMEGSQHPHDNPLVVRAVMANKTVHRVLIDNGSSVDIIFASAFDKMGIGREKLELVNTHLRGFSGEKVLPLGSIQLVLTLGDLPCQATTRDKKIAEIDRFFGEKSDFGGPGKDFVVEKSDGKKSAKNRRFFR